MGTRRTGKGIPSSVLRIGGAVIVLMTLGIIAVGVVTGERDPAIMGAFFAVMGTVGIVTGIRMGRKERETTANLDGARVAVVRFPPAEFARRVALVRARNMRQMHTRRLAAGAVVVTLVALFGLAQIPAVGALIDGIPEWGGMLMFFGFWTTVISGLLWSRRMERQAAEKDELLCPSCDQPLLGSHGNMRFAKLIEDEGLCPQCGVLIVEDVPA